MRVAGYNLGCKVNKYELDAILLDFEKNGDTIVDFEDFAEVYIVSTCSVTALAEKKSRKYINRTKKINPNAVTVALGCYIQREVNEDTAKDGLKILDNKLLQNIDIFIGTKEKSKVREYVLEEISKKDKSKILSSCDVMECREYEELKLSKTYDMMRAYVKIQDGCNNFCTYCIIPYVRGRERSRKLDDIIEETNALADNNVKEIVLTGIEVASYGKDLKDNTTLLDVVHEVGRNRKIKRIRLSSLEQSIIDEKFFKMCKKEKKLCNHFHLSLQSGSDTVLKRMNRKYTSEEYYKKIEMIRENMPDAGITTDVIVGFPEETDEEFNETYNFIEKVGFSDIHIFPYSIRTGTKAASMKQVSDIVKSIRAKKLGKLKEKLIKENVEKYIDKELEVLVEEMITENKIKYAVGHTTNFIKVKAPCEKDVANKIIKVKIKELKNLEVVGEVVWEE